MVYFQHKSRRRHFTGGPLLYRILHRAGGGVCEGGVHYKVLHEGTVAEISCLWLMWFLCHFYVFERQMAHYPGRLFDTRMFQTNKFPYYKFVKWASFGCSVCLCFFRFFGATQSQTMRTDRWDIVRLMMKVKNWKHLLQKWSYCGCLYILL